VALIAPWLVSLAGTLAAEAAAAFVLSTPPPALSLACRLLRPHAVEIMDAAISAAVERCTRIGSSLLRFVP
jgi:hypothetical protein